MKKLRVEEVIVVEGKYDAVKLAIPTRYPHTSTQAKFPFA